MNLRDSLLEFPIVYRLWIAPFAEQKLAPVFHHNDMQRIRRVLDVGCGPGTNAPHFARNRYLGLDFNARYIESARRRHSGEFVVADVTKFQVDPSERFDFILVNSLLHHLDDAGVEHILSHLGPLLSPDGFVHILELVMPRQPGIPRILAGWDRGRYPREEQDWRNIFSRHFDQVLVEPFSLTAAGVHLWNMIYFKGRAF
jgi:SAM-dependent methyltransferase